MLRSPDKKKATIPIEYANCNPKYRILKKELVIKFKKILVKAKKK